MDGTGRSQRMADCTGFTSRALRPSSVPFRPVLCHQIPACHSPPRCIARRYAPPTIGRIGGLALRTPRGLAHVQTHAPKAPPTAASGRGEVPAWGELPETPGAPGHPATLHIRRAPAPTRGLTARSIPRPFRSSAPGPAAPCHQTVAYYHLLLLPAACRLRHFVRPAHRLVRYKGQSGGLVLLSPTTSACSAAQRPDWRSFRQWA